MLSRVVPCFLVLALLLQPVLAATVDCMTLLQPQTQLEMSDCHSDPASTVQMSQSCGVDCSCAQMCSVAPYLELSLATPLPWLGSSAISSRAVLALERQSALLYRPPII